MDYGADISTHPDLDPTFALLTGTDVVAEALWRRFSTPRGGLSFHPNEGLDLREMLGESVSADKLARMKGAIEAEAAKDERVLEAAVTLEYLSASRRLLVTIDGVSAEGPFTLTLLVTALSVALFEGA